MLLSLNLSTRYHMFLLIKSNENVLEIQVEEECLRMFRPCLSPEPITGHHECAWSWKFGAWVFPTCLQEKRQCDRVC